MMAWKQHPASRTCSEIGAMRHISEGLTRSTTSNSNSNSSSNNNINTIHANHSRGNDTRSVLPQVAPYCPGILDQEMRHPTWYVSPVQELHCVLVPPGEYPVAKSPYNLTCFWTLCVCSVGKKLSSLGGGVMEVLFAGGSEVDELIPWGKSEAMDHLTDVNYANRDLSRREVSHCEKEHIHGGINFWLGAQLQGELCRVEPIPITLVFAIQGISFYLGSRKLQPTSVPAPVPAHELMAATSVAINFLTQKNGNNVAVCASSANFLHL
eukprot:jgi/Psemu1/39197/gm1.39197_g